MSKTGRSATINNDRPNGVMPFVLARCSRSSAFNCGLAEIGEFSGGHTIPPKGNKPYHLPYSDSSKDTYQTSGAKDLLPLSYTEWMAHLAMAFDEDKFQTEIAFWSDRVDQTQYNFCGHKLAEFLESIGETVTRTKSKRYIMYTCGLSEKFRNDLTKWAGNHPKYWETFFGWADARCKVKNW